MPTNVSGFGGECYATAYHLQGCRVVVLGTLRSDRSGIQAWPAAAGNPRSGASLTPEPGTVPGFFVNPYLAEVYYRIDPVSGAAAVDSGTWFGPSRPVTERAGFHG